MNILRIRKNNIFEVIFLQEDITDADYTHGLRVCKDFDMKNLEEYHDFYVQSNTLLLAVVFENFRNMCLKYMTFTLFIFFAHRDYHDKQL